MAAQQFKHLFTKEWYDLLFPILDTEYFSKLAVKIAAERLIHTIYPASRDIFRAFEECPLDRLKVVIVGQDPYHDGSADGLAFSNRGKTIPSPSLKNILEEVRTQIYPHYHSSSNNDLTRWANQGVLLLNRALTVQQGQPLSHMYLWDQFTTGVLYRLSDFKKYLVFMLWGKFAQSCKIELVSTSTHLILECDHPIMPSRSIKNTWTGNEHFVKANNYIAKHLSPEQQILW